MGTIYKRGDVWYLDIRVNGRRVRRRVGKTKRIAELALRDAEVKVAREEFGFSHARVPLREFFESFLDYSWATHRPTTTDRYRAVIDHFREFLLGMPKVNCVSDVRPEVIDRFKVFRKSPNGNATGVQTDGNESTRPARARTINFEIDTLRLVFNLAIKWGYIRENPTKGIVKLRVEESKSPRFLSVEECRRFLDACPSDLYAVYYTFLQTGMRKAELENLTWADVDLERRQIAIRRKKGWQPKTGEREIPISDGLLKLLRRLHRIRDCGDSDYVFAVKTSGKTIHNYLRDELIRIAKAAGIENLTKVHTLRHTFASHLVMQGVDLPTVQKLMGHSDISTTMVYAHLAPDHLSAAVNKLPFG